MPCLLLRGQLWQLQQQRLVVALLQPQQHQLGPVRRMGRSMERQQQQWCQAAAGWAGGRDRTSVSRQRLQGMHT
jgi:hypothetical protein